MIKKISKRYFIWIISFILVSCFVFFRSSSTSPFCPFFYGGDSAQFQTIGKGWALGKIPYRDMFDHKGPYIFFINMLGYKMTGTSTGVMIIQILNMFVIALGILKICQLYNKRKIYGLFILLISLFMLSLSYCDGNMTEEYCLPFITFSTYFQMKWMKVEKTEMNLEHNYKYGFFYGVSLAICILTRITNGVTICVGVLIIGLYLLFNKRFYSLLKNAIAFLVGIAIIVLPFTIYFALYGALQDFYYGMIGFNMEYQKNMESWLINSTKDDWRNFLEIYSSFYTSLLTIFLLWKKREFKLVAYISVSLVLVAYLLFSGAFFIQYVMITIPQFAIFINEVFSFENDDKFKDSIKTILLCFVAIMLINSSKECVLKVADIHAKYKEYKQVGYEQLLSYIPEDERDSFIAYGNNKFKQLYLLHDLLPSEKYFVIQEWHSKFSDYVKEDIRKTFLESKTEWIITSGSLDNIEDILEKRYEMIDSVDDFRLYHLRQ